MSYVKKKTKHIETHIFLFLQHINHFVMALTLSSWPFITLTNPQHAKWGFQGRIKSMLQGGNSSYNSLCSHNRNPWDISFSTHRNHDGSMSPNGKGHIILKKVFHWYNNLEISEVPKHTQQSYQSRYHQVMKTFTKDKKKSQLPLKSWCYMAQIQHSTLSNNSINM